MFFTDFQSVKCSEILNSFISLMKAQTTFFNYIMGVAVIIIHVITTYGRILTADEIPIPCFE